MNSYTFHITLYDLFFFGMIFIGLNFALLLAFVKSVNRTANRFLALALMTMILWMTRILAIDIHLQTYLPGWDRMPIEFLLALGPLIYFYVLKITRPAYEFRWKDLLHFSPVLLEQGVLALAIRESLRTGAATYATKTFHLLNPVLQLLIFISIITYLHYSYQLIQKFYRRLAPVLMDRSLLEFRWLRRLLAATALLWLLWIVYAAVDYFGYRDQLGIHVYYPFYIFFTVIIIWTATAAFLKPQAGIQAQRASLPKPVPAAELKEKGVWLKRAMEANLYHREPELTLSSLAEKLGIHPHELSRTINIALKKNFNDFVNEYRIRDVITKMQEPAYSRMTLEGIGFDSGFNSKSTFNRTFRLMTGNSPAEYKKYLEKERPTYHLNLNSHSTAIISNRETTPKWSHEKLNRNYMIRNYLKIAWRNMLHSKVYSALNITGLATGMAVALLIGLWVSQQFSYDRFWPNYKQLYQVKFNFTDPKDGTHTQSAVCLPLAPVLRNIAGFKRVAETDWVSYMVHNLKVGDKKFLLSGGAVGPEYLQIFRHSFVKGDPNTVFKDIYSIIIDESTAKALFGNDDPINKTIRVDNEHDVKVTGVYKDIPAISTTKYSYLLPFSYKKLTEGWIKNAAADWGNNSFEMWVELQPGVTYKQIAPKIKDLLIKYHPYYKNSKGEVILQPIGDLHLYSNYENGKVAGGFIDYVRMFSIVGALVLLIACINFMNLSTARSEKRAREVGVRKAIGSNRRELIFQFLTESLMITFAAFLFSVLMVQLALGPFNELTGSTVTIPYSSLVFWAIMIGYVLLTGLLAGSRPAFYLSSFNPVKVLKGTIQVGKSASLPRKILVVLQFSCSIALIISTVIIYQQIQYAKDRPTGYSPDRLVSTGMSSDLWKNYNALKNDLLASRMVENITEASSPLTGIYWHTGINKWPGQKAGEMGINIGGMSVADNYFKTVGMELIAGHDFSSDFAADTLNVIVNEAAVKRMGLKQPLNQMITYAGLTYPVRIIGVVKDALMESPFTQAEPTVFNHGRGGNFLIYRLSAGTNPHAAMDKISRIFNKYNSAYPFDYVFVDNEYDKKFGLETLIGKLAGIFAGLAIFISCLGLFGLAAYVAEQRTKEIGIRKVLGASIANVWMLLSKDFILLVVVSCVIASPVALYFLEPWLKKYDYHIILGPGVFFLSALAALIITLFTVSFQAIKAAVANPVRSLRSE
ncbi:MAG: ABC transporter permease [Bacteroidetes bacterium]|nr:ABC transporter permease [Bacteroidota bacterium]